MSPAVVQPDNPFSKIGPCVLLVIGALALQLSGGLFIAVVAAMFTDGGVLGTKQLILSPWVLSCVNLLALGSMIIIGTNFTREPLPRFLILRPFALPLLLPIVLISFGLAVLLSESDAMFLELMRLISPAAFPQGGFLDFRQDPIGGFVLAVLIAPVTEEYLFRGLILRGLLTRHRPFVAIVSSALLFGILHANLRQFVVGLALGSVFGWWLVRTASIAPCLLGHAVFNFLAFSSAVYPGFVPGLSFNTPGNAIAHQPLLLTLLGAAALAAGIWLFERIAALYPVAEPAPPLLGVEPPVLPASQDSGRTT